MLKYLRQLASESLVYGLAGTVSRFITLFLVPLYTRALTPADYGVMSLIRNTTTLVAMIASLSLDAATQCFYWDIKEEADRKSAFACWTWTWLGLTLLGTALIFAFSDQFAMRITGRLEASTSLRLAACTMPLNVLGVIYVNRLRIQRRPWAVMRFAIITSLMTIIFSALFVLILGWGVEGVFLSSLIVSLGATLVVAALIREWIHPRSFDWKRLRAMLRFSLPLVPALVSWWAIDVIDRYFLQAYTSTSQVGLYEIGYSIAAAVALGTMAFQQAWTPFALSLQDMPQARDIYANALVAYTLVGSAACAAVTLFAPEALRLLTTNAYYGASSVVACLAFSYFLTGSGYIAMIGMAIKKQTISMGTAAIGGAIVNVGLNFLLIPRYGKDGAAVATLIAFAAVQVYLFYRAQQVYPVPYRFGKCLMIILFAAAITRVGGNVIFESTWLTVLVKLGLLVLFLPLPLALRIVTLADLQTFTHRLFSYFNAKPEGTDVPSHAGSLQ